MTRRERLHMGSRVCENRVAGPRRLVYSAELSAGGCQGRAQSIFFPTVICLHVFRNPLNPNTGTMFAHLLTRLLRMDATATAALWVGIIAAAAATASWIPSKASLTLGLHYNRRCRHLRCHSALGLSLPPPLHYNRRCRHRRRYSALGLLSLPPPPLPRGSQAKHHSLWDYITTAAAAICARHPWPLQPPSRPTGSCAVAAAAAPRAPWPLQPPHGQLRRGRCSRPTARGRTTAGRAGRPGGRVPGWPSGGGGGGGGGSGGGGGGDGGSGTVAIFQIKTAATAGPCGRNGNYFPSQRLPPCGSFGRGAQA